jgi:ECF transporter S component (folate family)
MVYILSNLIAGALFITFGILAYFIQRKNLKKAYNTLSLTLVGLFCALSVIMTNVVGYSMIFGFKIMLGNFLIFLIGMLFGPVLGMIAGTVSDGVGILINLSGTFHFGFLFIKAFIGFCGGLVF